MSALDSYTPRHENYLDGLQSKAWQARNWQEWSKNPLTGMIRAITPDQAPNPFNGPAPAASGVTETGARSPPWW